MKCWNFCNALHRVVLSVVWSNFFVSCSCMMSVCAKCASSVFTVAHVKTL